MNELLDNGVRTISKLSIFLFIIAGNYVGDIYSCSLRHLFNEYMFFKHILGFFIMLLFVGLVQEEQTVQKKIYESAFLYLWFIVIMRAPMHVSLITILLITIMYILHLYSQDLKRDDRDKDYEKVNKVNRLLFVSSVLISFIGTISYMIYAKSLYKQDFNVFKFLIGSRDQECFTKKFKNIYGSKKKKVHIPTKIKKRMGM